MCVWTVKHWNWTMMWWTHIYPTTNTNHSHKYRKRNERNQTSINLIWRQIHHSKLEKNKTKQLNWIVVVGRIKLMRNGCNTKWNEMNKKLACWLFHSIFSYERKYIFIDELFAVVLSVFFFGFGIDDDWLIDWLT